MYRTIQKYCSLLTILIGNNLLLSQNHRMDSLSSKITSITYEEIMRLEDSAYSQDNFILLKEYIKLHTIKAKKEKNDLEIARSFYYYTVTEKDSMALAYADSISHFTMNSDNPQYPTLGFTLKGKIYYDNGQFKNALDNYLLAYRFALQKNNYKDQRFISEAIAGIRSMNGQPNIAVDLYKKSLKLLKEEDNYKIEHKSDYNFLLYNLSLAHLRMSELDSANFYLEKGLVNLNREIDSKEFMEFLMVGAQINYYNKDYQSAHDSLLKYIDNFEGTSKAIKLYYLAKSQQQLRPKHPVLRYYENIDSIVEQTHDPFEELKDVYYQLVMQSIEDENETSQVDYISKLIKYDSILMAERIHVVNQSTIGFDIPLLKIQKNKAVDALKRKSILNTLYLSFAILAVFSGAYFYLHYMKIKRKINALIENPDSLKTTTKTIERHPQNLPENIRKDILNELDHFESNYMFLDKDLDQSILAERIGTNTSYLSMVINHYKKQSFPNYLKDLRINYAIKSLSEDSELLKYNYLGLADIFGFKTPESFSKAFYGKTGFYPSKFIKELKNRKQAIYK